MTAHRMPGRPESTAQRGQDKRPIRADEGTRQLKRGWAASGGRHPSIPCYRGTRSATTA